jgi:hypothetical protein
MIKPRCTLNTSCKHMTRDFMDVVHLLWQPPKNLYEIIENIQKIISKNLYETSQYTQLHNT